MDVPMNNQNQALELIPDPAELDPPLEVDIPPPMEADPDGLLGHVVPMEPEGVIPVEQHQQQEEGENPQHHQQQQQQQEEGEGENPQHQQQQQQGGGAHPGQQQGGAHPGQQEGEGANPQQQQQDDAPPGQQEGEGENPQNPQQQDDAPPAQQEGEGANPQQQQDGAPPGQQEGEGDNPEQQQQQQEGGANPGQQQAQQQAQQAHILTPAEETAPLVTLFEAAIQTAREHQQRPAPIPSLKERIFKQLKDGHAVYLHQKDVFSTMPAPLMEEIVNKGGALWMLPGLAGLTIHPHTRRVKLRLSCCSTRPNDETWTSEELQRLFTEIALTCKDSLRTLDIVSGQHHLYPCSRHPKPSVEQLDALLRELRGLETLHLWGEYSPSEVEELVSSLAASNPGIKDLEVPNISSSCLDTIVDTWPELEALEGCLRGGNGPTYLQLAGILPKLRQLKNLEVDSFYLDRAMLLAARSHPPGSAPYLLENHWFCSSQLESSEDAVQLFTSFPAVSRLYVSSDSKIPMLCAGLDQSPNTRITRLDVDYEVDADMLEPLLQRIGPHLKHLIYGEQDITAIGNDNPIDINLIGYYCPQLESLGADTKPITFGDDFEVTDNFFAKLRYCSLGTIFDDDGNEVGDEAPDPMVLRLMSSPYLEQFNANVIISEEVAISLTAASGEGRALSSLEGMVIDYRDVSMRALAAILSHAPRMCDFTFSPGDDYTPAMHRKVDLFNSFVTQSGLMCRLTQSYNF